MRRAAGAIASIGICVMLAACGNGSSGNPTGSETPAAPARPGVLIWADAAHAGAFEQEAASFTTGTGMTVTVEPIDLAAIEDRVRQLAPQGQGPDLFLGSSAWVGALADGGLIVPVDLADRTSRFAAVAVSGFTYEGRTYGVPIETDNLALLRNTELAPEAPGSLEDMVRTGLALAEAGEGGSTSAPSASSSTKPGSGKDRDIIPIALPVGAQGDALHWFPLYSAAGGYLFGRTSDGGYDVADLGVGKSGSVEAAKLLARWTRAGALVPRLTPDDAVTAFTSGRSPYLIGGPSTVAPALEAGIPLSVESIPDLEGGSAARAQVLVTTTGLMASQFARNPAGAAEFLRRTVLTTQFMDAAVASSGAPPAWEESYRKVTDPTTRAFGDVARASIPTPNLAATEQLWTALGRAQVDVMAGDDPTSTMRRAGARIQASIDGM